MHENVLCALMVALTCALRSLQMCLLFFHRKLRAVHLAHSLLLPWGNGREAGGRMQGGAAELQHSTTAACTDHRHATRLHWQSPNQCRLLGSKNGNMAWVYVCGCHSGFAAGSCQPKPGSAAGCTHPARRGTSNGAHRLQQIRTHLAVLINETHHGWLPPRWAKKRRKCCAPTHSHSYPPPALVGASCKHGQDVQGCMNPRDSVLNAQVAACSARGVLQTIQQSSRQSMACFRGLRPGWVTTVLTAVGYSHSLSVSLLSSFCGVAAHKSMPPGRGMQNLGK